MVLEVDQQQMSNTIQCPECDHEIRIDSKWQEDDTFVCSNCAIQLQVIGVEPLIIDMAPKAGADWTDTDDEVQTLALDEVEEMEDEAVDDDEEDTDWGAPVSRRVATLRSSRTRPVVRKESKEIVERETILLTPEGAARLQDELDNLRTVRLPKVRAWLSDALAEGFEEEDVTELEEARSELSLIEGRIRKLETTLAMAEMLQDPESNDYVQLGSRVTVVEGDYEPETYRLVSPAEADPLSGFISDASPLGRVLLGKSVEDIVTVTSPDGPIEFRIVAIN